MCVSVNFCVNECLCVQVLTRLCVCVCEFVCVCVSVNFCVNECLCVQVLTCVCECEFLCK